MTLTQLQSEIDSLNPQSAPRARIFSRSENGIGDTPGKLGILDASFNPPTRAHEALAADARKALGLDEVLLMLSRANVDKAITGASLGQRLEMMLRWADSADAMSVGGCSHARFVDKAFALRPHYPPETDLTFILGFDTLERLFDPRYYTDMKSELSVFFHDCRAAVANRGDQDPEDIHRWLERPETSPFAHCIDVFSVPPDIAAMSSTEVRNRCADNQPIGHLVPKGVAAYVAEAGLYTAP
jgi:nicotinic acid mononucleotide adenylyltransferase